MYNGGITQQLYTVRTRYADEAFCERCLSLFVELRTRIATVRRPTTLVLLHDACTCALYSYVAWYEPFLSIMLGLLCPTAAAVRAHEDFRKAVIRVHALAFSTLLVTAK